MPTLAIYALLALGAVGISYGVVTGYNNAIEDAEMYKGQAAIAQANELAAEKRALEKQYNIDIEKYEREQLEEKFAASEKKADDLAKLFQEHEFENLYDKKPGLILNRVNTGSKRLFDELAQTINGTKNEFED